MQVHIDSYQSRLYGSLSDADERTSFREYSALNGFYVGNHHKAGCLTTETTTRIHSCEPGTPCHSDLLKAKHVVWITPIITRSREGLIVPEVGAGGGGGDLHPTLELDLCNISSISEVEELFKQIVEDPHDVRKLLSRIESARLSKDHTISLQGLELDAAEEISLQEFANRLLALDKFIPNTHDGGVPARSMSTEAPLNDTIYFPFSRHSSYTELCDLVAALKPSDIYPCTVEEQAWTENVSMRTLFGHLCSSTVFRHDEEMRVLLRERRENEWPSKKRQKRKDTEDSQASSSFEGISQEHSKLTGIDIYSRGQAGNSAPSKPEDTEVVNGEVAPHLLTIKTAYDSYMAKASTALSSPSLSIAIRNEYEPFIPPGMDHVHDTQLSIPGSAFESQSQEISPSVGLQLDGIQDEEQARDVETPVLSALRNPHRSRGRRILREEAYRAAKLTLQSSDSGAWDDLGIRSIGDNGHCKPEEEL